MTSRNETTLADVARRAKVSCSAAGKVLNGGSNTIRVGESARMRILQAARELDYIPNMAASILAGGASRLIGILLDSGYSFRYQCLLCAIEKACAERGIHILTSFTHENLQNLEDSYRMFHRYGVSGVICAAHDYPAMKDDFRNRFENAKDMVYVEKPDVESNSFVTTCRVNALTQMIAAARERGCRKIGMLMGNRIWQTERMLWSEFQAAMAANGLEVDMNYIHEYEEGLDDKAAIRQHINSAYEQMVLPNRPDFLYVDDGDHAAVLLDRLHHGGINTLLCGGDANPLFAALGIPSFDPCYEKIAEGLISKVLDPSIRHEPLIVEATAGDLLK